MRNEQGITIIETTVILSVLFILAGVMSPIVSESVMTARAVKAKSDASMIAMGLINLQKDVGADALAMGGAAMASQAITVASQAMGWPDVLASAGSAPQTEDAGDPVLPLEPMIAILATPGRGGGEGNGQRPDPARRRRWLDGSTGGLDDHLVSNRKGYRFRQPGEYGGWNGPYVSAEVKGDPWGNQYLINTQWLDGGSTTADANGNPRRAVFVVSAGNNGVIETPFEQPITDARPYGDDIVIRIQ
jgi:type II secretory pathway pseudopilin PulG